MRLPDGHRLYSACCVIRTKWPSGRRPHFILFGRVYLGLSGSLRIGVIKDWPHHPDVQSIIRDYSWFRIWQQIKKILNNNYDKSSINYFYFNQSDYLINKNRHFAFSPFCIFAISSAENRSSLLRKVFQPIRTLIFWAND